MHRPSNGDSVPTAKHDQVSVEEAGAKIIRLQSPAAHEIISACSQRSGEGWVSRP